MSNKYLKLAVVVLGLIAAPFAQASTEWSAQDYDLYPGDFNDDDKTDILYVAKDPAKLSGIATSNGSTPGTVWQTWDSNYLNIDWSGNQFKVIVADFNGDGKADIFLQRVTAGDHYLLLTDSANHISALSQTVANGALGLTWSADQHKIVAGDFTGDGKADLFLQATTVSGTNAVVAADGNGQFTSGPTQSWSDTEFGFNWSTQGSVVYVGDFNGDGKADLLLQAKPKLVMIDYDVAFPVPTYPLNKNGLVLSQGGPTPFQLSGVQQWSRDNNGVDWSPLTNTLVVGDFNGDGRTDVIFQAKYTGKTSYLLTAGTGSAIFPSSTTAVAMSSNIALTSDSNRLVAGNFDGTGGAGLYYQALTSSGTNYLANTVGASITASSHSYSTSASQYLASPMPLTPTAVGRTQGMFNVSPTGAATYQIPIWVPPGPKGIQPNLALVYNSQGGDGTMGPGWALAGLSAISRCNKTYAQDTTPSAVALTAADGYCLNGNRLRLVSGTYGADGSVYRTEIADFSKIIVHGVATDSATVENGPAWFEVWGKDGLVYQYGNAGDADNTANSSRIKATGTNTVSQWLLNKVKDRAGNKYVVTYGSGEAGSTGVGVAKTISYTASSVGATTYNYTVNLNYGSDDSEGGAEVGYVAGTLIKNTSLLTGITVKSGTDIVRKYTFTYQVAPATVRARLWKVQECAGSAGTDCLPYTEINYQNGAEGVDSASTTALSSSSSATSKFDFNGDGRADLAYVVSSYWHVAFATATGYTTGYNTGALFTSEGYPNSDNRFIGDVLGNGKDGILAIQSGTWWYYSWNNNAFTGVSTGSTGANASSILADMNGDGLPDLVYVSRAGYDVNLNVSWNASSATSPLFSGSTVQSAGLQCARSTCFLLPSSGRGYSNVKSKLDFNGDGVEDLYLLGWGYSGYNDVIFFEYMLVSNGTAYSAVQLGSPVSGTFVAGFGRFNDDTCDDVVYKNSSGSVTQIYISACSGGTSVSWAVPTSTVVQVMDWDGDGRDDLLVNNGGNVGVYKSTGSGVSSLISTSIAVQSGTYFALDQNGDGLVDLGLVGAASPYAVSYQLHNSAGTPPDLVTSITDGHGVSVSPAYTSIAQSNYTKGSGATHPEKDIQTPMYVVSQVTASDGIGSNYTQSFSYAGARENLQGLGFQGFDTKRVVDSRNSLVHYTRYMNGQTLTLNGQPKKVGFPYTGMVYQDEVFQANDTTPITKYAVTSAAHLTLDGGTYFPHVVASSTQQYEVGGNKNGQLLTTSTQGFTYDTYGAYGNATSTVVAVTDNDTGSPASPDAGQTWTTTTTNTFNVTSTALSNWCIGLPTRTEVTKAAPGSSIPRKVIYGPNESTDANDYVYCRPTQIVTEPDKPLYKVTEVLGYDSFGNVNSHAVTGNYDPVTGTVMPTRTTTVDWGATGQFPEVIKDPVGFAAGYQTRKGYDYSKGVQVSEVVQTTSGTNNAPATTWLYDNFARKTRENRPNGTATAWVYAYCSANGNCVNANNKTYVTTYVYNADGSIQTDGSTFYDVFDRPLASDTRLLTGGYQRAQVQYDNLGRTKQQSIPGTNYWITSAYDALNRVTRQRQPINAGSGQTVCDLTGSLPNGCQETAISYLGRTTTTTDPLGKNTTKVTNVTGSLRHSKDHNGYYQNFTYDAFGSLTEVKDSPTNTLFAATYDYGMGAFQRTTSDKDLGNWSYSPNALGEVVSYQDAKSQSFAMSYDALSRPTQRRDGISGASTQENLTTWTWGTSAIAHNIGQLASVSSQGYSESYTYDALGRSSNRSIQSDVTYNYDFTYHGNTGQLDTLTYPASTGTPTPYRLKLQYLYQNGRLQQVKDANASTVFWRVTATNQLGQITQEMLGNNIKTTRTFDAVTGRVSSIQSGVNGGAAVQNESYLFDLVGNVTQRQNNNLGLTESFCYDAVYRLDHTTATGSCTSTAALQMQYDNGAAGGGNITSRNDVENGATWTYDSVKKHAVRTIGSNLAYTYDDNGNMLTRGAPANSIGWTSYNYPSQINGSGESVSLFYDANRQRYKQELYSGGSLAETTMYVGGMLEKVTSNGTTDYRHYIYAGGKAVAIMSRLSTGTNTTRYVLEDHQGSVAKIADGSGTVAVSESFTAFGARRNPTTWSGSPSSGDLAAINAVSRTGYTGHTALGNMGLNHMNGRVQDAITGRFLSADPYVAKLCNTQAFNRYAYVNNNPMSFTDPSGFTPCDQDPNCPLPMVTVTAGSQNLYANPEPGPLNGSNNSDDGAGKSGGASDEEKDKKKCYTECVAGAQKYINATAGGVGGFVGGYIGSGGNIGIALLGAGVGAGANAIADSANNSGSQSGANAGAMAFSGFGAAISDLVTGGRGTGWQAVVAAGGQGYQGVVSSEQQNSTAGRISSYGLGQLTGGLVSGYAADLIAKHMGGGQGMLGTAGGVAGALAGTAANALGQGIASYVCTKKCSN